jgi:hypothetical protein
MCACSEHHLKYHVKHHLKHHLNYHLKHHLKHHVDPERRHLRQSIPASHSYTTAASGSSSDGDCTMNDLWKLDVAETKKRGNASWTFVSGTKGVCEDLGNSTAGKGSDSMCVTDWHLLRFDFNHVSVQPFRV